MTGPNILLVMADQLSALATGPYGNPDVLTPNLDSLARSGTRFRHAYCPAPLCAPSRAALFTGMLASDIPVNDNAEELAAGTPTFAHVLRAGGYQTALSGKMHFVGPDQHHGLEERLTADIYPSDFLWASSWSAQGNPPRRFQQGGADAHQNRPQAAEMMRWAGPLPSTYQMDYDEEVHFRALERLRQLARRRGPRATAPWFVCVSYTQPHDPYAPTPRYWDRYEGREISLPTPAPAGASSHVTDWWANTYHGVDVTPLTDDDVYRTRRASYAMTSYIDDRVGELLDELDVLGQREDTVVMFTSDHGDMLGEHGMFFKRTLREWSSRIPLIVAGPDIRAGSTVEQAVSLVDMFPTVVELSGLEMPEALADRRHTGASLVPQLRGAPGDPERAVIIENNGEGTVAPIRAAVTTSAKYIATVGEDEQLYDLGADPDEWQDVHADPAAAARRDRLAERCLDGWDGEKVKGEVEASQSRRAFLHHARRQGLDQPWDAQPPFDARRSWLRAPAGEAWDRSFTVTYDAEIGGG